MNTRQPSYLVLQCYGNEGIFLECAFALLSLSRLYKTETWPNFEIWLYTDQPEWFSRFKDCPLPLNFRKIDQPTIQKWRGDINFVHRVKIEVLLDFAQNHDGNILYADTDVVFTHSIDSVFEGIDNGALYMHMQEGRVSDCGNPLLKKLNTYLHSAGAPKINNQPLYDLDMWNAGILGFNTKHKNLLQDVLNFTDEQYRHFPKHVIEQFAFSAVFQSNTEVKAALPFVLHYWNMKEARVIFKSFFTHFAGAAWADLALYSSMIQLYELVLQKIRFGYNRTLIQKIANKKWQPADYNWAELTKQL